jgi:hypothetical protein
MTKLATTIIGACGEHYVAAYLSRLGFVVAMPRGGTSRFDLLVTKENGGRAIQVQVKTGTNPTKNNKAEGPIYLWRTNASVLKWHDSNLWYAYVNLKDWPNGENLPEVFFVPSKVVVKCLRDEEQPWFWMYKNDAKKYNDSKKYRGNSGLRSLRDALDS